MLCKHLSILSSFGTVIIIIDKSSSSSSSVTTTSRRCLHNGAADKAEDEEEVDFLTPTAAAFDSSSEMVLLGDGTTTRGGAPSSSNNHSVADGFFRAIEHEKSETTQCTSFSTSPGTPEAQVSASAELLKKSKKEVLTADDSGRLQRSFTVSLVSGSDSIALQNPSFPESYLRCIPLPTVATDLPLNSRNSDFPVNYCNSTITAISTKSGTSNEDRQPPATPSCPGKDPGRASSRNSLPEFSCSNNSRPFGPPPSSSSSPSPSSSSALSDEAVASATDFLDSPLKRLERCVRAKNGVMGSFLGRYASASSSSSSRTRGIQNSGASIPGLNLQRPGTSSNNNNNNHSMKLRFGSDLNKTSAADALGELSQLVHRIGSSKLPVPATPTKCVQSNFSSNVFTCLKCAHQFDTLDQLVLHISTTKHFSLGPSRSTNSGNSMYGRFF
ncbi:unnamed protein product [Gongylonema pulchrum]|uniref:C2H2-type domain-containing protein n=1 Tax=Gongylonema pulchrum TaxID=637853 RepID=A0A183E332_9BILA|nr:unnamed protein product [Gongylonema pulchrum]